MFRSVEQLAAADAFSRGSQIRRVSTRKSVVTRACFVVVVVVACPNANVLFQRAQAVVAITADYAKRLTSR